MVILETLERRALLSAIAMATIGIPNYAGAQPAALQISAAPISSTQASATQSAQASAVRAYSWSNTPGATSISPMVWAALYDDPVAAARRAAPALLAMQPGDRVVFLWNALDSSFKTFDPNNPAKFIANGPDIAHDRAWCLTFFGRLKALGVVLDRVVVDSEGNFSTWALFSKTTSGAQQVAMMKKIYGNSASFLNLPPELRAMSPTDFDSQFTARGKAAYIAWNNWASKVAVNSFKAAITQPLRALYGSGVALSNYGDITTSTQIYDLNGWPAVPPNWSLPGNVNSPACYLTKGNAYANYQKKWQWNRLIDILNTVRACQRVPGASVTPWLSYPGFRGDNIPNGSNTWLWDQMVRQLVAGGVSSFYYWNPSELGAGAQDAYADSLFKSLTPGTPGADALQPIAFDADEIVTNGVRISYSDFLQFFGNAPDGALNAKPLSIPKSTGRPQSQPTRPSSSLNASSLVDSVAVDAGGSANVNFTVPTMTTLPRGLLDIASFL